MPYVGHINVDSINQRWLDQRLCEAAAVRWHYDALRAEGQMPARVVRLEDVDPASIPLKPVKRVEVDRVFALADEK